MTVDEIFEKWEADSKIDPYELDSALLNIPKLHEKYLRILSVESKDLRFLKTRLSTLKHLKEEYYSGALNGTDELKELGWDPFLKKVLKNDIPGWIESDKDVIKLVRMIGEQEEKVSVLTSILKEVSSMSWNIRGAIEWRKFQAGA